MADERCAKESRISMGSVLEITLYGTDREGSTRALAAAFAEAARLETLLSAFRADSEVSRINRLAHLEPVSIDPELVALLDWTLTIARITDGAVDPTVGPLMRLWGFRDRLGEHASFRRPTTDLVRKVRDAVGYRKVILDKRHSTVAYKISGMAIEFGALGKGYAVDRVVNVLKSHGIDHALVSFRSSLYALGHPPELDGWRVAIRHPRRGNQVLEVVQLRDQAMATSGDYEQGVGFQGIRHGHILDPRTGYPATGTAGVSVIAPSSLEADAFSTALFVLGSGAGLAFLADRTNVEGLIVAEKKDGAIIISPSDGWDVHRIGIPSGALTPRRRFLAACLALIGWLVVGAWPSHAVVYMSPEEAARKLMPEAREMREEEVTLTAAQKEKIQGLLGSRIRESGYHIWIGEKNGTKVGYAVVLDVIGKEQPITFLIAVNDQGRVVGVEILAYRESQGGEIRSKRFRDQFVGKTVTTPLRLGKDLDSISGATLSARSTAFAVKKALALVEAVFLGGGTEHP